MNKNHTEPVDTNIFTTKRIRKRGTLKGLIFYDRFPAGRGTKNLATVFDEFGWFFVVFVFTLTSPIFFIAVLGPPNPPLRLNWGLRRLGQRTNIGVVLVKTKPTEKNQPNPSKTEAKIPIKIFGASAFRKSVIKSPSLSIQTGLYFRSK